MPRSLMIRAWFSRPLATVMILSGALALGGMAAWPLQDPAGGSAATGAATEAPKNAHEKIIIGRVNAHGFQNTQPDDPGLDVDATAINIAKVLADLGDDARLWYQHVMTLSNPYFEGRATGTPGNERAADYLEFWFRKYGLEPAFPEPAEAATEEPGGAAADAEANAAAAGNWVSYRQPFTVGRGERTLNTANVGGVLRGKGALANEWVVIGAHFDHVGYSGGGRRANPDAPRPLNPGADDNASGTAGMLILARRFTEMYAASEEGADLRSILFMGFSGEEMGLLGAAHYVRHSTLDADSINLMINLDMIGRLRTDSLMVQGVHSAEGLLDRITPHLLASGLTIYADPIGQGPSDHARFYGAGIPVLFMFTGTHESYHRPGDHGWTVNPHGAVRILDLTTAIARDMVTEPSRLKFSQPQ